MLIYLKQPAIGKSQQQQQRPKTETDNSVSCQGCLIHEMNSTMENQRWHPQMVMDFCILCGIPSKKTLFLILFI